MLMPTRFTDQFQSIRRAFDLPSTFCCDRCKVSNSTQHIGHARRTALLQRLLRLLARFMPSTRLRQSRVTTPALTICASPPAELNNWWTKPGNASAKSFALLLGCPELGKLLSG